MNTLNGTTYDILKATEEHNHQESLTIVQTQPSTQRVDRMLGAFNRQWLETAEACVKRAVELENAAADLRLRAEKLLSSRVFLDDVKDTVVYEIESRDRTASLMFVNPSE